MAEIPDPAEKLEKNPEKTNSTGLSLDRIETIKDDAKALFKHLMPGLGSDAEQSRSRDRGSEIAEKPIFDPSTNKVSAPDETARKVADVVDKFDGKIYNDKLWCSKTMGQETRIMQYLYFEEGTSLTDPIMTAPLRSGKELELYRQIKNYAKTHDITDPEQKIGQEQIMLWSLNACKEPGSDKVTIQDALLTAHNVMRALARPEVAKYERLSSDDPVRQIIEDSVNHKTASGKEPGLPQLMREKYSLKSVNASTGQELFDKNNEYSLFKPNAEDRNTSTGSAYHFWVGAFAASSLGSMPARAMVFGEGAIIKGNSQLGQHERPWGGAGVTAWDKMPNMRWKL